MKPLSFLLLALVLSAGVAHAQDNNTAFLYQTGSAQQATINQVGGPGNEATITQAGDHGIVLLTQTGAGNTATINAGPGLFLGGSSNEVLLLQSDGAWAKITQAGSHLTVWGPGPNKEARSLDGSVLWVTQLGYGHELWLDQQNGAVAIVVQMGASNTASITQSM